MAVGGEREVQQPGRLQKLPSGRHIGQQLTAPEPPIQPFALGEHRRVQPDAGVVQKQVSIDFADVYRRRIALRDQRQRRFEVERDAEVLREVVEGAERQHAERLAGVDKMPRHGCNRAVTPSGDDDIRVAGDGAQRRGVEFASAWATCSRAETPCLESDAAMESARACLSSVPAPLLRMTSAIR